ncbi:MAG: extracellular solute-binding protein, partial [Clostridia bacterium]|nr:extracellular solute-binding protein [Clostridia bacterium]
ALFLLLIAAAAAASVSCGTAENSPAQGDAVTNGAEDTAAVTEVQEVFDPLASIPDKDYNGYEFTMFIRPGKWYDDQFVEKENGDIVDDEIFRRNSRVSEKFNITMKGIESSSDVFETDAMNVLLAGEDAYDVIAPHGRAAFDYSNRLLLLDWNTEPPGVNLDNPWWDQDARNSFSINHKLYVMTGDISYSTMGAANVMLFNKKLFQDWDIAAPYQDVLDGKWTFEKFASIARNVYADLNGDGVMDENNDLYGYITQKWVGPVQAFATSGLRVVSKDENDVPYISFFNERTVEVFNRYFNLLDEPNVYVSVYQSSTDEALFEIFKENRALFLDMNMRAIPMMRSMDTDFGIVPWPKYDEAAEYCTNVDAGTTLFVVPNAAKNPERTGLVLEALGAYGYYQVIPAYYEVALQGKTSRDNESADMLDIIKAARIFDFGYYNASSSGSLNNEFVPFAENLKGKRDLASWYEKNLKSAQKGLDKVIAAYNEE